MLSSFVSRAELNFLLHRAEFPVTLFCYVIKAKTSRDASQSHTAYLIITMNMDLLSAAVVGHYLYGLSPTYTFVVPQRSRLFCLLIANTLIDQRRHHPTPCVINTIQGNLLLQT